MNATTLRTVITVMALTSWVTLAPVSGEGQSGKPPTDGGLSPKALFYTDTSKDTKIDSVATPSAQAKRIPAPAKTLVLRASVKIIAPGGGFTEVPPTRVFRAGERIRIALTSNKPGYVYVATVGSSGGAQLAVPLRGENPPFIQPNQTYDFPRVPGVLEFDGQVGNEEIYVFFAETPLDTLDCGEGRRVQVGPGTAVATVTSRDLVRAQEAPEAIYIPAASGTLHVAQKLVLVHR